MSQAILTGKGIYKAFGSKEKQTNVLNGVDVEIYAGDFTVIMGSSGAGKSTLLYALCGMDNITKGMVFYGDRKISSMKEKEMAELRAKAFGFVFQQTHLVSNLTLFENVAVTGYLDKSKTTEEVRQRTRELFEKMNISDKVANRLPSQVSGGEAQRAAIARAVINEPEILFADEPTGALNKSNTEEVLNLFNTLNREGQSILMVTHDLRAAIRGTRLLYLDDGKIIGEKRMSHYEQMDAQKREMEISTWLTAMEW